MEVDAVRLSRPLTKQMVISLQASLRHDTARIQAPQLKAGDSTTSFCNGLSCGVHIPSSLQTQRLLITLRQETLLDQCYLLYLQSPPLA